LFTTFHWLELSRVPKHREAGAEQGPPKASQLITATCKETNLLSQALATGLPTLRTKTSGNGTGIGQSKDLEVNVEVRIEPVGIVNMERTKLAKEPFILTTHLGNEFTKAGTLTVVARAPGRSS
jgi:hypothetical protein